MNQAIRRALATVPILGFFIARAVRTYRGNGTPLWHAYVYWLLVIIFLAGSIKGSTHRRRVPRPIALFAIAAFVLAFEYGALAVQVGAIAALIVFVAAGWTRATESADSALDATDNASDADPDATISLGLSARNTSHPPPPSQSPHHPLD
jgi:hypothetical protein